MFDPALLSPLDFEDLVGDLLSKKLGFSFERFSGGKDGGVDLRWRAHDRLVVIQCKRFIGSNWSTMKSALKKEASKAQELGASEYYLALACDFTPGRLDEISDIFGEALLPTTSIFTWRRLEALLRSHEEVLRSHPKLWAASSEVMTQIIHADAYTEASWALEDATRDIKVFVRPNCWAQARDMLADQHVCIIAGPPGIGKTMLAKALMLEYAHENFETIVMGASIDRGLSLFKRDQRQLFYFDDFLGQSDISEATLRRNEDSALVDFIRKIQSSPNKRFILTTREYILRDAFGIYEPLARAEREKLLQRIVLDLAHYARFDRARILFNHLWSTSVTQKAGNILLDQGYWKRLVDHPNYSPRLLRLALAQAEKMCLDAKGSINLLQSAFDEPTSLWADAFDSQLNEIERAVLLVLRTIGGSCPLRQFAKAVRKWCGSTNEPIPSDGQLRQAYRVLEGTFVKIGRTSRGRIDHVGFHNPSVHDFLSAQFGTDEYRQEIWLNSIVFIEQLISLVRFYSANHQRSRNPFHAEMQVEWSPSKAHSAIELLSSHALERSLIVVPTPFGTSEASFLPLSMQLANLGKLLDGLGSSDLFSVGLPQILKVHEEAIDSDTLESRTPLALRKETPISWSVQVLSGLVEKCNGVDTLGLVLQFLEERQDLVSMAQQQQLLKLMPHLIEDEYDFTLSDADNRDDALDVEEMVEKVAGIIGYNEYDFNGWREEVEEHFDELDNHLDYEEPSGTLHQGGAGNRDETQQIARMFRMLI